MKFSLVQLLTFCSSFSLHVLQVTNAEDEGGHYLNDWVAEIPGGLQVAKRVADNYGFKVTRELLGLRDHYLLKKDEVLRRSKRSASHHTRSLTEDHRVVFAEQQSELTRAKRRVTKQTGNLHLSTRYTNLNDPEYRYEWYINQDDSTSMRRSVFHTDLRVKDVWNMGITGKNISISVIDDGLEWEHPDLKDNYDPIASYDFNGRDPDPSPRYDPTNENKHGTRCAGVMSMVANNNICGVGVAFDSRIGGLKILDGPITDHVEAEALSFKRQHIHMYTASWGPKDSGMSWDGPRAFSTKALTEGVSEGRGGKGSLFVWASGNGGTQGDCCSADGYASAIETISVSSVSQEGRVPFYAERCPSTLTTAYSSGQINEARVVSADIHHLCTDSHTGTSAAAPMVAGIIALLLEVNPNVTWRDVQHILVHTSRPEPLTRIKGWYRNGAGYCVNPAVGFGLVDALAVVQLGNPDTWRNVGPQRRCLVRPVPGTEFPIHFKSGQAVEVNFETDGCLGTDSELHFLEHVQVFAEIDHPCRGRVRTKLKSARGTLTTLMYERPLDKSSKGFYYWPFMSVHNWGESPRGTWVFKVEDRSHQNYTGSVKNVTLSLYGTREQPEYRRLWRPSSTRC